MKFREECYETHLFLFLICINLPFVAKTVIREEILIGNPAADRLKLWIPDRDIRANNLHSGR